MSDVSTDVVVADSAADAQVLINGLRAGSSSIFSTLQGDDFDTSVAIFDAVSNAEDLSDHLNETIFLKDVIAQAIEIMDEETQLPVTVVRTVLVSAEGEAFAAISTGLVRALQTLFGLVGQPSTWDEPLPILVVEKKSKGVRKYFTVNVDRDAIAARKAKATAAKK